MTKVNLITFGCSWTFGIGGCYTPGQSKADFRAQATSHQSLDNAFRAKLSEKYDLDNEYNFAYGGNSNQRNFRLAREFFHNYNNDKKTIVLWGITSTARTEVWDNLTNEYQSLQFDATRTSDRNAELAKIIASNFYDHENEVESLQFEMHLWNNYFKHNNIEIIWFDTFNTHAYGIQIDG